MSLASENWNPWGIIWRCVRDPAFRHFGTVPACDRRTDRQTDGRTDGHTTTAHSSTESPGNYGTATAQECLLRYVRYCLSRAAGKQIRYSILSVKTVFFSFFCELLCVFAYEYRSV